MAQHEGGGDNVVTVLMQDHHEIEELFGTLEQTPESSHDERRRLTDQVIIELVRHSVAEEQHLYPAARQHVPGGDQIADRELSAHQTVEATMAELEQADPGESRFGELLGQLITDVRSHVHEEETELFPQLAQNVARQTLEALGERISTAKKSAPTRPHPSAPSDRPDLMKVLGPGAGLVDRARDYLSGRGT